MRLYVSLRAYSDLCRSHLQITPVYTAQASRRCHQLEDSRHDEAITIARTINLKQYVIVIINSVVTNDDAINISEVIENMNMTISVTTSTRPHRATPQ